MSYDDLSDSEVRELQSVVARFLSGTADLEELPTDSLKRIRETYKAMRAVAGSMMHAGGQQAPAAEAQMEGQVMCC